MRVEDLDLQELLEMDPEGGVIRFAGQRVLLLDAVAMGLLRKYLVENFGLTAAHSVFTQVGFAHGWRAAEAAQSGFQWESPSDWIDAGARIHALEGTRPARARGEHNVGNVGRSGGAQRGKRRQAE